MRDRQYWRTSALGGVLCSKEPFLDALRLMGESGTPATLTSSNPCPGLMPSHEAEAVLPTLVESAGQQTVRVQT